MAWAYGAGYIYDQGLIWDAGRGGDLEVLPGSALLEQPRRPGYTIRCYDRSGVLLGVISSNGGMHTLIQAKFDLTAQGPGRATLELSQAPEWEMTHGTRVDIHLWNDPSPYWSGFLTRIPGPGSSARSLQYRALGFVAQASWGCAVTATYNNQQLRSVVDSVARSLEQDTEIRYSAISIETNTLSTYQPHELQFVGANPKEMLDELADMSGGMVWGVGADRKLFFRTAAGDVDEDSILVLDRDVYEWEPEEDSEKLRNVLRVKLGQVRDIPNSPYHKTNYLENLISGEDSQDTYGVRCGEVSAPSIFTVGDAARFGGIKIDELKEPERRGRIRKMPFDGRRWAANRTVRILSKGTSADYNIERASFTVDRKGIYVDLSLGRDLDSLPTYLSDLNASRARAEHERQLAQKQL